jgi:hypothetical protein
MVTFKTTSPDMQGKARNIFEGSMAGGKMPAEKLEERTYKKNLKKGYTYMLAAAVFLMGYSIYFLYPQVNLYLNTPGQIDTLGKSIDNYSNVILPNLQKERDMHKAAYDEEFQNVEGVLNTVFPADTGKLEIIKMLENFATSINTEHPPFEFNSISFDNPKEENGYTILPISTTIHSSTANFGRFLGLIDHSGHLDAEIPVRLMEISNINIRYRGTDEKTGEDKGVDFTVKLNAYSR